MANTSISGLTGGAAVAAGDLFPDVQTVGVGPVKVTAAQLKTFMSASPTLVTPTLGVAAGTSLALGGATIGSNALAVTGKTAVSDQVLSSLSYARATPQFGTADSGVSAVNSSAVYVSVSSGSVLAVLPGQLRIGAASGSPTLSFLANNADAAGGDLFLYRAAAATLQLGAADASSAVAQTLQFQSSTGAATTGPTSTIVLAGGVSASGAFQIQKKVNGTPTTILDWGVTNGGWSFPAGSSSVPGVALGANGSTGIYSRSGAFFNITAGGTIVLDASAGNFIIGGMLGFTTGNSATGATATNLVPSAAVLALQNSTTQQEFRVFQTTTGTKYKALAGDGNLINVSGYAFTDGAAAALGTLTNAPAAGNPTKWIPINDNGTTRYIPAW